MKKLRKSKWTKRIIVAFMAMILVAGIAFQTVKNASASIVKSVDADTRMTYEDDNFLGHEYSTEFAGRIWTDKTVEEAADNNFLVTYSALATGKAVTGKTQAPLDIVFVIDVSGSMANQDSGMPENESDTNASDNLTRMHYTVEAVNTSIETIMEMNEYTRVGVVIFSNTAQTVLPLGRYEKSWNRDYLTLNSSRPASGEPYAQLTVRAQGVTSRSYNVQGGTNIQQGIYTGASLLTAASNTTTVDINGQTVNRIPALVFLSDGFATYSSNSANWWAPDASGGRDGNGSGAFYGNGMKAMMTGAYVKQAINTKYGVTDPTSSYAAKIHTIGIGIKQLTGDEANLANVVLNPKQYYEANNTMASNIRSKWSQYIQSDNRSISVLVEQETDWWGRVTDINDTLTHPNSGDITSMGISTWADQYHGAEQANSVANVFSNIVHDLSISVPEVPTEVKGEETLHEGGYLTYRDTIGAYMEVKTGEKMTFNFHEKDYVATYSNGSFVFDANEKIIGSDEQEYPLNNILIKLTEEEGLQVLEVKIPAVLIPLRVNKVELNADGQVISHTHNEEVPCRLTYTVGLLDDVYDASTQSIRFVPGSATGTAWSGQKLTDYQNYLKDNAKDGTVSFYTNLFTGEHKIRNNFTGEEHTVGNAIVSFEPSHSNAFYYVQDTMPIYEDASFTKIVTADTLNDATTYYYKETFYHEDDVEVKAVARTGIQLKNVSLVRDDETGEWFREVGSIRKNKLQLFENTKKNNVTGTAQDYYASEFIHTPNAPEADGYFMVHLGNNGVLKASVTGNLEIAKTVTADEGLTPPDKEFTFKVEFNGTNDEFSYAIVDVDGTKSAGGLIGDGDTLKLKAGEKALIANIPANVTYEVTEEAVVGFTTSSQNAAGAIPSGNTVTAAFTNHYSATSVVVNENDTTADFAVQKDIAGDRSWNSEDQYTFILESNRVTTPMPAGSTPVPNATNPTHRLKEVTITSGTAFAFGEIEYTKPGTYTYTISERVDTPGIAGISYSGAMYQVVVEITDDGAGTLSKTVAMTKLRNDQGTTDGVSGFSGTTALFVNTFDADHVEWTPVGTKDYTDHSGSNPLTNGMFKFNMAVNSESPANTPMPDSAVGGMTTDENIGPQIGYDSIVFGPQHIVSNNPGKANATIYKYDFTEDLTGTGANASNNYTVNGMKYDERVITVEVYVYYNNNMEIVVEPVYPTMIDGIHYDRVVFFNEYTPKEVTLGADGYAPINGTKTLTGREWLGTDSFEFVLEADNTVTRNAVAAGNIVIANTSITTTKEAFAFGNVTFKKPGTYRFKITETAGSIKGMTYDGHATIVTVVVTDNAQGQLAATVAYNNQDGGAVTNQATFTNSYRAESSAPITLTGTKTLTGRDMKAGEFFLNITAQNDAPMGDSHPGNAVPAAKDGVESAPVTLLNNIVYTEEGTYVYLIKEHVPSDEQKLGGITYDENTVYRVTVTVEDDNEGKLIATPVIEKSIDAGTTWTTVTDADVKFHNTYTTQSGTYNPPLYIWKRLEGKELEADEFTFKVEEILDTNDGMFLPTQTEVGNRADGAVVFKEATFTKPGKYQVKITEVIPVNPNPGITYSDNELIVEFTVVDNGYGILEIEPKVISGEAYFDNIYETEGTLVGATNLQVTKNFTGRENDAWLASDRFTFALAVDESHEETVVAMTDGAITLPTELTLTVDNTNKTNAHFGDIVFTKPGTYQFTVTETNGGLKGIAYDTTPRTIIVTAIDKGDGTMTVALASGSNTLTFNNTYGVQSITATLEGKKKIEGREFASTDIFDFTLAAVGNAPLPSVTTVSNDATGNITFAPITFTAAGTYEYKITETGGSAAGVTDITNEVRATVTVEDNNEGQLEVASIGYSVSDGNGFAYTNQYTTTETDGVNIDGIKVVTPSAGNSYTLEAGDFTFEIAPANNNPSGDPIGKTEVTNQADGTIEFAKNAVYTQEGTYVYTVREIAGSKGSIDYDDTQYTVTVEVIDNKATAKLSATVSITKGTQTVNDIEFENGYTPGIATVIMAGEKKLESEHISLEAGMFQFKLEASGANSNQTPMPANGEEIVSNDAAGNFQFGKITYEAVGEYTYKITEVDGGKKGFTYDDSEYVIEVKVIDNDGTLEASVTGMNQVVFTNGYTPEAVTLQGQTALRGKKQLTGRALKADEFKFRLIDKNNVVVAEDTNDAAGNFAFEPITFTEDGTYYYTVVEIDNGLGGVTYDKTVYTVKIDVTDVGGELAAAVSYLLDGNEKSVVFDNSYKAQSVSVQLNAAKKLKGRELKEGEFTFVLKNKKGEVIATAVNAKDGLVAFDEITYTQEGTYVYKITEEKGNTKHVTYDDTVYKVTVKVRDNGEGSLEASVNYHGKNPVFTNKYKIPKKTNVQTGDITPILPTILMLLVAVGAIVVILKKRHIVR